MLWFQIHTFLIKYSQMSFVNIENAYKIFYNCMQSLHCSLVLSICQICLLQHITDENVMNDKKKFIFGSKMVIEASFRNTRSFYNLFYCNTVKSMLFK